MNTTLWILQLFHSSPLCSHFYVRTQWSPQKKPSESPATSVILDSTKVYTCARREEGEREKEIREQMGKKSRPKTKVARGYSHPKM